MKFKALTLAALMAFTVGCSDNPEPRQATVIERGDDSAFQMAWFNDHDACGDVFGDNCGWDDDNDLFVGYGEIERDGMGNYLLAGLAGAVMTKIVSDVDFDFDSDFKKKHKRKHYNYNQLRSSVKPRPILTSKQIQSEYGTKYGSKFKVQAPKKITASNTAVKPGSAVKPTVIKPASNPVKPTVIKPAANPVKPTVIKPAANPVKPTVIKPAANPVKPTVIKPAANPVKPTVIKPAANPVKPTVIKPAANPVKPTVIKPAVTPVKPTVIKPAVTPVKPTVIKPAATPVKPTVIKKEQNFSKPVYKAQRSTSKSTSKYRRK
ncbi:hypothetical protein [Neptuniibacter sp. QD37_11]|uniref:hypothetical protein n=1 Tax=Neptuniibacter sp. QD37_11 TaxID=3398209 RepID=UPI0039F63EDB